MNQAEDSYDLESVKLPYLSGISLKLLVALVEGSLKGLLVNKLFRDAGIQKLREIEVDEPPTYYPLHPITSDDGLPELSGEAWNHIAESARADLPWASVKDFAQAYRSGASTPLSVAENVLAAVETSNAATPPLRAVIATNREDLLKQATASAERLKAGKPLSILEGVPVAVKDELDLLPYPTKVGTKFLGLKPCTEDATIVARLRSAGALLVGKTNMHEIGIGVTGLNPHHGVPRNPYNAGHYTGGSSSGSASAVAAGLCPFAVGADGGGSIRIPSALCGLVGLKSTFGRMSEAGAAVLVWSVAHNGALANNAADAALAYAIMAGKDPKDEMTLHQPTPTLAGWSQADLKGVKLGVFRPWFEHATEEVVSACDEMLKAFCDLGAKLIKIVIPGLDAGRVAHLVTIASEMSQALAKYHAEHHKDYGLDVRLNLALAREFTARDLLQAQRVRTQMIANFNAALDKVDFIVTPATGIVSPKIPAKALPSGESDLTTATEIMRFAAPANLTGLPAISFPAGYSKKGLPIGMQAIGRAWEEHRLLHLAHLSESVVDKRPPQTFYDVLNSR